MTEKQKQNTIDFLKDNELLLRIEKNLKEAEDEESATASLKPDVRSCIHNFDFIVQPGDIRMFSQTDVLTYCVVLPWDEMHCLVVPFSHRKFPATDEEMFAEHHEDNADYCQVLQIWNARTVNASLMANTWKIGKVSDNEICRIKKLLGHFWFNDTISDDLADLTGLPIKNSLDPRVPYKAEELKNFDALDGEDIALEYVLHSFETDEDDDEEKTWYMSFPSESMLAAAAGEGQLSEVFLKEDDKPKFITGIELLNFEPAAKGEKLPCFIWSDDSHRIPEALYNHPVIFLKRGTEELLGTGTVEPDGNYCTIHLRNPVNPEDVPELNSPNDIILLIL